MKKALIIALVFNQRQHRSAGKQAPADRSNILTRFTDMLTLEYEADRLLQNGHWCFAC